MQDQTQYPPHIRALKTPEVRARMSRTHTERNARIRQVPVLEARIAELEARNFELEALLATARIAELEAQLAEVRRDATA